MSGNRERTDPNSSAESRSGDSSDDSRTESRVPPRDRDRDETQTGRGPSENGGAPPRAEGRDGSGSVSDLIGGDSIASVLQRHVAIHALLGVAAGIIGYGIMGTVSAEGGLGGAILAVAVTISSMVVLSLAAPILAPTLALQTAEGLDGTSTPMAGGVAGGISGVGHLLVVVPGFLLTAAGYSGGDTGGSLPSLGEFAVPVFLGVIGAALVAAGTVVITRKVG